MHNFYHNKEIFISGASRGLGYQLALQALEQGASKIYATARSLESLNKLTQHAQNKVIPLTMELSDFSSIKQAVDIAQNASIIINNAGILHFGNVLTMPIEAVKQDICVNHLGTLHVIREFYTHLQRHSSAHIVNILSIVSLASKAGIGGYATSKAAAFSATQAIRGTLSKENVKVHAAFPGGMDTDMLASVTSEDKDAPSSIASEILKQVANNILDIYPGHAHEIGALWSKNPRQLQRQFTGA